MPVGLVVIRMQLQQQDMGLHMEGISIFAGRSQSLIRVEDGPCEGSRRIDIRNHLLLVF